MTLNKKEKQIKCKICMNFVCFFYNCGIITKEKDKRNLIGGKQWQKNMCIYLAKEIKI